MYTHTYIRARKGRVKYTIVLLNSRQQAAHELP